MKLLQNFQKSTYFKVRHGHIQGAFGSRELKTFSFKVFTPTPDEIWNHAKF